ncbi:ABC transporter substrate-binding protein [Pseudoruegeria sp. SHC-113]|uniref:ABC transporter substrate-binding protein n=1 Tax=Pseudoruegeria sp. SHC-113 TaxID=2855439 RepID=UPI0021BB66F7|nr:sugar ABC transporter substrate-binding protein [Pseudoruegeria sp. SHC-113]MCT8162148.1 sugar ABC transporter substrate-binding protein [Pseudoruegeria sp. SHC-113]
MKRFTASVVAAISLAAPAAATAETEITVWGWGVAAKALDATVAGFNAENPDIKVTVENLGYSQVKSRVLAACAAGGTGLPDVFQFQNIEMELIKAQFPDCATDLVPLGFDADKQAGFPDFKLTALRDGERVIGMPWDTGPAVLFYRRDFYKNAGVDPESVVTWEDFHAAGKKIMEANPGVTMSNDNLNGGAEWFRMIANEQGCGYFSEDGESITVNQPGCVAALEVLGRMVNDGLVTAGDFSERVQNAGAGVVATAMNGAWFDGTLRDNVPAEQAGLWGVTLMPTVAEGGSRAANVGGSLLAIADNSDQKDAAYKYLAYTLGTNEGQITMLREYGLVPSLLSALEDPFVKEPHPFYADQTVWETVLGRLDKIKPATGTPFFGDADQVIQATQIAYIKGEHESAQSALDDAAKQISFATGLPIAK